MDGRICPGDGEGAIVNVAWEPQPWQAAFIACPIEECFGGGARGGGKSDGVLGDWLNHADIYKENAIGLMVRRTRTELLETHERARVIYGKLGAKFTYQPMRVIMPGGGRLTFSFLDRDSDAEAFQGSSFSRVYVEEVGNFPSRTPVMKLMATLRSGAGVPVGMRLTGNPGGPGHGWVRARYIDPAPRGWKIITDPETGSERIYLPSRVAQNKYLGPDYVRRLRGVGTPELVKAWLEGDWSVVAGAFFSEWSSDRHIIAPRALPEHWARFRSFDWGSARPFAVHWWAVSDGTLPDIARGCLVCYREWYGMKPGQPNVGLHMTAEQVAEGIRDRERDDPTPKDGNMPGVADPSIFAEDGGPSIAARMVRAARVIFRPADNKRVPQRGAMGGWDQVRARLVGDPDGKPMVIFFSTSTHVIRTLPALQHDASRAEDVDTESEDHCADGTRYAVMSRPYVREMEHKPVRDSWDAAFNRDQEELRDWRVT